MRITINNNNQYYFLLVIVVIIILFTHYPRIYGVDAFQVVWMANALDDNALFSENSCNWSKT